MNFIDGETLQSTHTGNLDLLWLPKEAMPSHVLPVLSYTSLVSIKMLCDAGCKVSYNKEKCLIFYRNKLLWQGTHEPLTRFCILPLCPGTPPENLSVQTGTSKNKYTGNAYQITSKGDLIWYLRQCLLLPPKQRLIKVIWNNQLATFPGLTLKAVENYPPDSSPAIDKGHMKLQQNIIRTTQDKLNEKLNVIEIE